MSQHVLSHLHHVRHRVLGPGEPQFPHLENGDYESPYLMGLLRE